MRGASSRVPVIFAISAVIALVMSTTAAAAPLTVGPLVQVSGVSPFAGCTADDVKHQSGTNVLHSEVEPWVDANPFTTGNLLGAYQQDRWSNGGARGLVAAASFDGGSTWATVPIPGITLCSGGTYQRATDPWVSFGPSGRAHQLSLSFNDKDFDHALLASFSTDGGLSWSSARTVRRDTDANVFNDKQSITADPSDAGFVYAVWDRLVFPPDERASVIAGFRSFAFRGPAWFARSTTGGDTWEAAKQIFDPGVQSQTIGNQIVVLPNGDLVDVFALGTQRRIAVPRAGQPPTFDFFSAALITSADRGVTWSSKPTIIERMRTIGVTDPESGASVRTGDIIPDIAVDRQTGNLYAVWQDARFDRFQADGIAFSMSTDSGRTWSAPIQVNKTPASSTVGNEQAFTASVHVSGDGTVAVTYYDFRNNTSAASLLTDYWVAHCHSLCTDTASWSESRLTTSSFDMTKAPDARGFFTGDYEGLTSIGTTFGTFFSQSHGSDPASVFFRSAAQ